MKLCYQAATPDVAIAPSVTAFQGSLNETFARLSRYGYDRVELMTLDPSKLDWEEVKKTAVKNSLEIVLICTGEIYGQLGLSLVDENEKIRAEARERVCGIIDFAGFLGANINIGRVHGQYRDDVKRKITYRRAVEAFRGISRHAAKYGIAIALESVTIMQTNFINTIAEAAKMVDDVGESNFNLMMDVFHLNIEEKNLYDTIRSFNDYNIHVHLADNNRRYPGQCGLNFRRIIQTFYDSGYDGAFSTEIYQLPDQDSAAKNAVEYLTPIFKDIYNRPSRIPV
jgi:sugar phosphate isomerase/epimerase